jgi:hypothetical protein
MAVTEAEKEEKSVISLRHLILRQYYGGFPT